MSFISNDKWKKLKKKMVDLNIVESDIDEKFVLGTGSGGQKINKTHATVQLRYKELFISVGDARNRDSNRYFARVKLCEQMEGELGIQTKSERLRQKKIKQKKRRTRRSTQGKAVEVDKKVVE